jgi:hypothetical protein
MRRLLGVLIAATTVLVLDAPQDRAATSGSALPGATSPGVSAPRRRLDAPAPRRFPVVHRAHAPVHHVVVRHSPTRSFGVTVQVIPARPAATALALEQNYPNPFNTSTAINYSLVQSSRVTLRIYSVLGARVATLINQYQTPGRYSLQWDGSDDRGRRLGPGVYLYRIDAGGFTRSQKLVIR